MDEIVTVLVVEDEYAIRKLIGINLKRNGFDVIEAASAEEALDLVKDRLPQVAILDIMLPGLNGYELCEKLRDMDTRIAVIMLTAKGEDMDKVLGFEIGADDYIVKPFSPVELIARIKAILRRVNPRDAKHENLTAGALKLDLTAQLMYKHNQEITLTPQEFSLLKYFLNNRNVALSRDNILNNAWGEDYMGELKTVDVHVSRLRDKIEDNPSVPRYILTVWGHGYRFQD